MSEIEEREKDHSLEFWGRVDSVVSLIFQNPRYLNKKRSGELTKRVVATIKKEKKISISERTAQRYIVEAKKVVRNTAKADIKKNLDQAVYARMSLVERARISKDLRTELATLRDIAELQGLYPDKKINVKGEFSLGRVDLKKLTDEQLSTLETLIKKGEDPKAFLVSIGIVVD